jgi:hypothetical protein
MRSRGIQDPQHGSGRKAEDHRRKPRPMRIPGNEGSAHLGECGIDADVRTADDIRSTPAWRSRASGRVITDDQHMWQRATQRGQGVQRRPGERRRSGSGYDESRLCMLDWLRAINPATGEAAIIWSRCRHSCWRTPLNDDGA